MEVDINAVILVVVYCRACSKYYHVDAYKATYAPEMGLLKGQDDWDEVGFPVLPLILYKRTVLHLICLFKRLVYP